jgi:hypothetical protein
MAHRLFPSGTKTGLAAVTSMQQGDGFIKKTIDLQKLLAMAWPVL